MDEAERCDRVGLIMDGALFAEGAPEEIPQHFSHDIIAVRAPCLVNRAGKIMFPEIVLDVQMFGDRLHLTVEDAGIAQRMVYDFLVEKGICDISMEHVTPSIEDVFMEKMGHEKRSD